MHADFFDLAPPEILILWFSNMFSKCIPGVFVCECVRVYVCACVCVYWFTQLWLCLDALWVINEHHTEVLSSSQWMGQDGKPRTKVTVSDKHSNWLKYNYHFPIRPLCNNHDDSVTQALILCDLCGNLCGDCDRILHLPKKMKSHMHIHQRQFKFFIFHFNIIISCV